MSDPLRVLAICTEDPEDILGGMGMHLRENYRAMARGHDVRIDLLTVGGKEGPDPYLGVTKWYADNLVCYRPRNPGLASWPFLDIQLARTVTRMIADGRRWDVVHAHEWSSIQTARMVRDALRIPMVGTMHLCLSYLARVESPAGAVQMHRWSDGDLYCANQEGHLICDPHELILCSQAYVDIVRSHFMTDRQINLIYNGVNVDEWNPDAGDGERAYSDCGLGFADGLPISRRPVALYCGRIATMKGVVPLIEAIESADSGWQVVMAGDVAANTENDVERWEVTRRIRALEQAHPERLRWVKFKHGQALRDLYALADVVLMPSIHEPFGLVALEAMAMGTPLIATDVDGLGEIVCDASGREYAMVVRPRSPGSILAALRDLRSPELRAELVDLGMRRVRDFTWDASAARTVDVYRRAVERGAFARAV